MSVKQRDPAVCSFSFTQEGKDEMTKASINLQDLRRRIYIKAKTETTWRFWGLYVHVCKMETLSAEAPMICSARACVCVRARESRVVGRAHASRGEHLVGEMRGRGDCQDFCVRRFPSCAHEALFEHDGELRLRLGPLSRRSFPIRNGVVQNQI